MSDETDTLLARLRNPPFGTESSERNLMIAAADKIKAQERAAGMREAAGIADKNRDVSGWVARDAILARADAVERGE